MTSEGENKETSDAIISFILKICEANIIKINVKSQWQVHRYLFNFSVLFCLFEITSSKDV